MFLYSTLQKTDINGKELYHTLTTINYPLSPNDLFGRALIIRKINQMDASKNNNRQFKIHKTSALNILNDLNKAIIANEVTSRGRLASTGAVVNRFRTSRIH